MSSPPFINSRSPPPLQHPKPTHPAYPPPEPPHTPAGSTHSSPYSQAQRISQDGYMRYSSPPVTEPASSNGSGFNSYAPPNQNQGRPGFNQPSSVGGYQDMGFGGWSGMNDATAQMGVQFGKSAVAAGQDYVEKNFNRYLPLPLLKTSFSVTNSYVLNKIRLVLFPWRHKTWARRIRRSGENGSSEGWHAPRDDINAPDLYIPTMAIVTYTLLSAFASGLQSRFHPEVLGVSLSKALGVVFVEFLAIRLGLYLLDVRGEGASGVELVGYGGYKFVGIIATILVSFLNLGRLSTGAVFVYTFGAQLFFLLRSLKHVFLPDPSTSPSIVSGPHTLSHGQRSRRVQFLFVIAVLQIVWMGLLARV